MNHTGLGTKRLVDLGTFLPFKQMKQLIDTLLSSCLTVPVPDAVVTKPQTLKPKP
jgi:hypothetical protein